MSEYQYYEFQAIDRPLSAADRQALRDLSTRARITPTSFTNSYEWGDFRGDPRKLMEQWFDLHLYLANWGSRRLMMRLPARLVDRKTLNAFLTEVDFATLKAAGGALILDIQVEEVDLALWCRYDHAEGGYHSRPFRNQLQELAQCVKPELSLLKSAGAGGQSQRGFV